MTQQTLAAQFAALHAQRERDWSPEQLAKNVGTRADLVRRYDAHAHVQVGDTVEDFTLIGEDGEAIGRDQLLARGPAVLIFYRFGGCPACNIALPHYDRHLSSVLREAGIPLVAISPQTPVDATLRARQGLSLQLAADPQGTLADRLGIAFETDTGAIPGVERPALPQPTILILGPDARVRFVAASPDWLDRPEADVVLAALPEVARVRAAA
ncbi:peroxiredoxin-like family protein [Sphingomonas immobilis]|uniref:Peroxiredoxin-like family protein n=1 Tax=Sphingomonas immobilis TaxID=3063997 RepID=A0ABT8ZWV5_9SPHN|nr:peroxiredoxin-like family protein [Sphingomonas sp. CA1-15]MDO7842054.1 peroxiredoxin-like family protein [Sphingomonas sp. CA1-15]